MITAGGKNLTPANVENDLKRSRWISQAVMHADRRPFPVALITLDPEEIVHFAREHSLPEDVATLSREPKVLELIQGELDTVNARYAQVEQIKKFFLLDHDLSQETGELTPTLKVKRNVINDLYAASSTRSTRAEAGAGLERVPDGAAAAARRSHRRQSALEVGAIVDARGEQRLEHAPSCVLLLGAERRERVGERRRGARASIWSKYRLARVGQREP